MGFRAWIQDGPSVSRREFYLALIVIAGTVTLALAGVGVLVSSNRARAREGQEAHLGLCASKANLVDKIGIDLDRIETTVNFLAEHPRGITGVPPAVIARGLTRDKAELVSDQKTLQALRPVICTQEDRERSPTSTTTTKGAP